MEDLTKDEITLLLHALTRLWLETDTVYLTAVRPVDIDAALVKKTDVEQLQRKLGAQLETAQASRH